MTAVKTFTLIILAIASVEPQLGGASPFPKSSAELEMEASYAGNDEQEFNEENGLVIVPHKYGDLILTPEQEKLLFVDDDSEETEEQGIRTGVKLWPKGVVPYTFAPNLSRKAKRVIKAAMKDYRSKSCIRFVKRRRRHRNYLYFAPIDGCYSYLGVRGGKQEVSIDRGCENKGIVLHELFHALGRIHEQNRMDRKKYVRINWNNIKKDKNIRRQFKRQRSNTRGLPYDYGSIMHYGAYAFSRNNKKTITTLKRGARIGQRNGLSRTDWKHVKKNYCQKRG